MPIKPENKSRYPKNWKEISADIRYNRADNRCEFCGVPNNSVIIRGEWDGQSVYQDIEGWIYNADASEKIGGAILGAVDNSGARPVTKVILTVAHLDHNPENNDPENLKALCQRCHNRYDKAHRMNNARKTRLKGQTKIAF